MWNFSQYFKICIYSTILLEHQTTFCGTQRFHGTMVWKTGILSELRAGRPRNCSSIPGRGKTSFCLVVIVLTGVTAYFVGLVTTAVLHPFQLLVHCSFLTTITRRRENSWRGTERETGVEWVVSSVRNRSPGLPLCHPMPKYMASSVHMKGEKLVRRRVSVHCNRGTPLDIMHCR
jgi:hypothetical protein